MFHCTIDSTPFKASSSRTEASVGKKCLKQNFEFVSFSDECRATLDGPNGWRKEWCDTKALTPKCVRCHKEVVELCLELRTDLKRSTRRTWTLSWRRLSTWELVKHSQKYMPVESNARQKKVYGMQLMLQLKVFYLIQSRNSPYRWICYFQWYQTMDDILNINE